MTTLYTDNCWADVEPDKYFEEKDLLAARMIANFENATDIIIHNAIEELEVATPITFARYTNSPQGAVYGYYGDDWDSIIPRIMTIHAADFAEMEGLKIRGVRGSDVRISRLEVKSGPQWLGNRELNLLVKSSGGEKKIPFKGSGTTDGLEREVGIYLTIEGGPQTWGTISLY